ncbi:pentatricopeptide repeat-containing protein At1g20230-like [Impatiens glandulifera]|uniref:pentatricopeptide repeat-containing protein At1g20230-like n=1 Tax=Impatiens glandulifera TaxID=253017 RepID=UPI001FB12489|nr:pentatricopeptide repeat-containing protein At1g20230-like [Impatiens glandulifera]
MNLKVWTEFPSRVNLSIFKKCLNSGDLVHARQLFDKMSEPNVRSSTVLIDGYTKHGYPREGIKLYRELQRKNIIQPDKLLLLSVIKACAALANLDRAKEIHTDAIKYGFDSDLLLGNALIDMYGRCKCAEFARHVFGGLIVKDVISWTSIASCFILNGMSMEALQFFREMGFNRVRPNSITLSSILRACSDLKHLRFGREIHGFVIRNEPDENVFVTGGLINMYGHCSSIDQAETVFNNTSKHDTVSWNVMLTAFFANEEPEKALCVYSQMIDKRVKFDYASWNVVIGGCLRNDRTIEAFQILRDMQKLGFKPNQITITTLLTAFATFENLRGGKETHGYIFRNFLDDITSTNTALLFAYAKCGELEASCRVFDMMKKKDKTAWTTMIVTFSLHGDGKRALSHFQKMLNSGFKPDAIAFTGVLSGCSHSCLVDEAREVFKSMKRDYSVEPDAEHYSCMIDVLGRAGHLDEAYRLIQTMPMEPTVGAWGALLGACRTYKNVDLGRVVAEELFAIEPKNAGNYALLTNIFSNAKLWEDAAETRKLMRERGIRKEAGCSWIRVKNKVYSFVAGEKRDYFQADEIYKFLEEIGEKIRLVGYKPKTEFVLQDIEGVEEKEDMLCNHSEKLAVAFGILNLNGSSSVSVFKNLRICGDCHSAIKCIAKVVGVRIVVRDCQRFHHFSDGVCSCGDFW